VSDNPGTGESEAVSAQVRVQALEAENARLKAEAENARLKAEADYAPKKASLGLLLAGAILSVCGWIGLIIALLLVTGKVTTPYGYKVHKYDEQSRTVGKVLLAVAILSLVVWTIVSLSLNSSS
jgi:uncharacterized membrane protein